MWIKCNFERMNSIKTAQHYKFLSLKFSKSFNIVQSNFFLADSAACLQQADDNIIIYSVMSIYLLCPLFSILFWQSICNHKCEKQQQKQQQQQHDEWHSVIANPCNARIFYPLCTHDKNVTAFPIVMFWMPHRAIHKETVIMARTDTPDAPSTRQRGSLFITKEIWWHCLAKQCPTFVVNVTCKEVILVPFKQWTMFDAQLSIGEFLTEDTMKAFHQDKYLPSYRRNRRL